LLILNSIGDRKGFFRFSDEEVFPPLKNALKDWDYSETRYDLVGSLAEIARSSAMSTAPPPQEMT
jgi:hypothetical protein